MNVTPSEAPIYGGGEILLEFANQPEQEDDDQYFVVFQGTELRHVVVAAPSWSNGVLLLKADIPRHNQEETVELRAYTTHYNELKPLCVSSTFQYASDSAYQMAVFLLGSVDEPSHLDDIELICRERFHLTPDVQVNLDERLTAAFKALQLPPCWNMMGKRQSGGGSNTGRLLHFSARLGLIQLSRYFLTLPGGRTSLSSPNHEGYIPEDLAHKSGFHELSKLLKHCREQGIVCPSSRVTSESEDTKESLVVTRNTNWNYKDIECDVTELNGRRKLFPRMSQDLGKLESMKELHLTKNGAVYSDPSCIQDEDSCIASDSQYVSSLPRPSSVPRSHSPRCQARVLEDNLRRLRDIHEGIQKLRELNTKQIVVQKSFKSGSPRLSSSCPALYLTSFSSGENASHGKEGLVTMRNTSHQRTSFSTNSRSLDSTCIETINVKIHVNDVTPSVSQECLNSVLNSEKNYSDRLLGNGVNYYKNTTTIGGTASERLAKKTNKKVPVRRQSWSSVCVPMCLEHEDGKHPIQRRWSLSSLDSDTEDSFCESSASSMLISKGYTLSCQSSSASEIPEASKEKLHILSIGSCEDTYLAKSGKQSVSVPSICDIATEIKENVEPEKNSSTGSLSSTAKNFLVSFRNHPLQKSLSTPSIAVKDNMPDKAKQEIVSRQSLCTVHPLTLHDINDPAQACTDVDENATSLNHFSLNRLPKEGHPHPLTADSDEEKPFGKRKKRSSIFFKKKPDKNKAKEGKKTAHQFCVIPGNTVICDVCLKPFVKKQALKCENCLVVVHDSSCKDQVLDCNKFKLQRAQSKSTYSPISKDGNSSLSSFNVPLATAQNKISFQQSLKDKHSTTTPFQSQAGIPYLCEAATRSSFINLSKMVSEEKDNEGGYDISSNMMETNSASMESLDEGAIEISDLEDNQTLRLTEEEPETWNITVDKKVLKKLSEKEVKRQEAIYELIITEKHHCLTLQIMQKVYAQGMMKELNMSHDLVERILPAIGDLLEIHKGFLCKLRERQNESPVVQHIADILQEQFTDQKADHMTTAYGHFCSQHIEALNLYKEISKTDRKFQTFIKKCSLKRLCKARGIPECLLLVTQRITKYLLVVESLIKAAKDNKDERVALIKVLNSVKDIISQVDAQVAEKEKEIRLLEIYNKMDSKTVIFYRGKKFKKSDLLTNNRKLKLEGQLTWRSPRGKTIDVLALMLSDFIFFVHENNQKYFFASLENKPGVVSLQKLLVRKKAGQDSRGMYLISSNPSEPEMLELRCRTGKEQKIWMDAVRDAAEQCPDEDEGIPSETEEERKLEAARSARIKELMDLLHEKDIGLSQMCEDRMRILADMLEVVGIESEPYENVKYTHLVEKENGSDVKELITLAINNVSSANRLANSLYVSGSNLSRSVSSAGEHQSETYISPLLPKRAETFGGFDNPSKDPAISCKVPGLKKKLLHLKEYIEPTDLLPLREKFESELESTDSFDSSFQCSVPYIANSMIKPYPTSRNSDKQHNRKHFMAFAGATQRNFISQKDVTSELMKLTVTPLLMTQGKEQLVQIVELAHHLNTLVCTVNHLSSAIESMKVQVAQSNDKVTKLAKEREGRDRRTLYRPEHQLEELRNLQKQLNHDRAIWQQEKSLHEVELRNQKAELERLQEQLKTEQSDVTHQRELLYRKLDALQKQGIILSPSHTVVNLHNCNPRDEESRPFTDLSLNSLEYTQHKRAFSYDLGGDHNEQPISLTSNPSMSLTHRSDSKSRPSLSLSCSQLTGKSIPLHLSSSATNLQKRPSMSTQPIKQQLPLKLANNNSANGALVPVSQGPQQVLPLKLALGSLPTSIPSLVSSAGIRNSAPKRSHSAASSPSSTLTTPVHIRGGSSPALVQTAYSQSSMSPKSNKVENNILMKLTSDKLKNKKDKDNNEEIFC